MSAIKELLKKFACVTAQISFRDILIRRDIFSRRKESMTPLEGRQIKESRTDDFLILCLIARVATSDPNKILDKFTLLLFFFFNES